MRRLGCGLFEAEGIKRYGERVFIIIGWQEEENI